MPIMRLLTLILILCLFISRVQPEVVHKLDYINALPDNFYEIQFSDTTQFQMECTDCEANNIDIKYELYKKGTDFTQAQNILELGTNYIRYTVIQIGTYFVRAIKTSGKNEQQTFCQSYKFNSVVQSQPFCNDIRMNLLNKVELYSYQSFVHSEIAQDCYIVVEYSGPKANILFSKGYSSFDVHYLQSTDRFDQVLDNPQKNTQYFLWIQPTSQLTNLNNEYTISILSDTKFYWNSEQNRCQHQCTDSQQWNQITFKCEEKEANNNNSGEDGTNETVNNQQNNEQNNGEVPLGLIIGVSVGIGVLLIIVSILIYKLCMYRKEVLLLQDKGETKQKPKKEEKPAKNSNKLPQRETKNDINTSIDHLNPINNGYFNKPLPQKPAQMLDLQSPKKQAQIIQGNCSICLNRDANISLVCGHIFHRQCLGEWLKTNDDCPHCRINQEHQPKRKVRKLRNLPPLKNQ